MPEQIAQTVGCFIADFRDGKVIIGRMVFPAGFFFMNALNEYWNPDYEIAPRLIVFRQAIWNVSESLKLGYIDSDEAEKVQRDIQYMLNTIKKVKPFLFLNLENEKQRCDQLFSGESVQAINRYLKLKANCTQNGDTYWEHSKHPDEAEIFLLDDGETLLNDYTRTMVFYNTLGEDIRTAKEMALAFLKDLDSLKKRDESSLIKLALQCVKQADMQTVVSYIAVPKSSQSKTLITTRRMTFTRFIDFLVADFYEGLHFGHYPKQCKICKRYFLRQDARDQQYCDGIDPNDLKKRPCRRVAADKGRKMREKGKDHPIKRLCATRLNTIRVHFAKGKITAGEAAAAKRIAQNHRSRALRDYKYAQTKYKTDISQEAVYREANVTLK